MKCHRDISRLSGFQITIEALEGNLNCIRRSSVDQNFLQSLQHLDLMK